MEIEDNDTENLLEIDQENESQNVKDNNIWKNENLRIWRDYHSERKHKNVTTNKIIDLTNIDMAIEDKITRDCDFDNEFRKPNRKNKVKWVVE